MDSNDLFSFLDEAPPQADSPREADGDVVMKTEGSSNSSSSKKRKAAVQTASPSNGALAPSTENEAGPSEPKKQRLGSPKPVVVDEVEIEAKREVDASAGLMGSVEAGSRLELRHQVSPRGLSARPLLPPLTPLRRCATRSRCRPGTRTCRSRSTSRPKSPRASTSSRWTRSSRCRCTRSSATRACSCRRTRARGRRSWRSTRSRSACSRSSALFTRVQSRPVT